MLRVRRNSVYLLQTAINSDIKKCLFLEVMLCGRAPRTAFNLNSSHPIARIITQLVQLQNHCLLSRFSQKFIKKCKDYKMSPNDQLLLFLISFSNLSSSSLPLSSPSIPLPLSRIPVSGSFLLIHNTFTIYSQE